MTSMNPPKFEPASKESFWRRHIPTRLRLRPEEPAGFGEKALDGVRIALAVPWSAWRNNIVSRAASLSFTTMISLIPLAVLVFSMVAVFDGGERLDAFIKGRIIPHLAPDFATQLTDYTRDYISPTALRRGVADWPGAVALIGLIIAALQITTLSERYLNDIWRSDKKRGFLQRLGVFWIVLTISPFILFIMMQAGDLLSSISGKADTWTPWIAATHGFVLPFTCGLIAFFAVFRTFPNTTVKPIPALVGALVSTFMWEGARHLFFLYIQHQSGITSFYPKLATIPLFLIWIWLNWVITLLGCECVHAVQHVGRVWEEFAGASKGRRPSRMELAVRVLDALLPAHRRNGTYPNELHLAAATGATAMEVLSIVRLLESKHYVVEIAGERRWSLGCAPEVIRIADVWRLVLDHDHDHGSASANKTLDADLRRATDATIEAFGDTTLAHYVEEGVPPVAKGAR